MITNLVGRRARGTYMDINPKYDAKHSTNDEYWVRFDTEGEIVAVFDADGSFVVMILDTECRLRQCPHSTVVVLPRDHVALPEGRL